MRSPSLLLRSVYAIDCLARGLWGAGIAWQARRPSYGNLRRCARRGALANQSPTPKIRASSVGTFRLSLIGSTCL